MSDPEDLQRDAEESLYDDEPRLEYCAICCEWREPEGDPLLLQKCIVCGEFACLDCCKPAITVNPCNSADGVICLACLPGEDYDNS